MIKIFILDSDGVYFLNSHQNFKENLKKEFNLSDEQVTAVYFQSPQMKEYKLGKISGEQFWSWAIDEWHINTTKEKILEILARGYEINQQAQDLVEKLKAQNIKIATCTNNFPERIMIINKKLDFLKNFDLKIFSYETGALKSDRKIFEVLLERSKVQPQEILFFDDKEDNINIAKELNINAFYYEGFDKMKEKIKEFSIKI